MNYIILYLSNNLHSITVILDMVPNKSSRNVLIIIIINIYLKVKTYILKKYIHYQSKV